MQFMLQQRIGSSLASSRRGNLPARPTSLQRLKPLRATGTEEQQATPTTTQPANSASTQEQLPIQLPVRGVAGPSDLGAYRKKPMQAINPVTC
jgi:hypothetical protein